MYAITAIPVGGGQSFVISDGTGQRGPGGKLFVNDFNFTFDGMVQKIQYLSAAATRNKSPGGFNQSANIPLEVEYEFNSEGNCLQFIKDLQVRCPVLANVTITSGGVSLVAPNVHLRPLRGKQVGQVSLRVVYPLTFGMFV